MFTVQMLPLICQKEEKKCVISVINRRGEVLWELYLQTTFKSPAKHKTIKPINAVFQVHSIDFRCVSVGMLFKQIAQLTMSGTLIIVRDMERLLLGAMPH